MSNKRIIYNILNSFLTLTLKNSQEYALKIIVKIERVEINRNLSLRPNKIKKN